MEQLTPFPTASLVKRLLALVYDTLLLLGVAFAYGVIVWCIRKLAGDNVMEPLRGVPAALELFFLWLVLSGYYVICWTKRGQTLGMKSWRLRLEPLDGGYVNTRVAWTRTVLAAISLAPFGLGYLWCLWDKRHGCWHDRWTKTRVVLLPKK